ncbi:hypothetical protein EPN52_00915 [bacterium]|nr:MAG: hypothetical protein EPN52_00915 [bacterium]
MSAPVERIRAELRMVVDAGRDARAERALLAVLDECDSRWCYDGTGHPEDEAVNEVVRAVRAAVVRAWEG